MNGRRDTICAVCGAACTTRGTTCSKSCAALLRSPRVEPGTLVCAACHQPKSVDDFSRDSARRTGRGAYCKPCRKAQDQARRQARRPKPLDRFTGNDRFDLRVQKVETAYGTCWEWGGRRENGYGRFKSFVGGLAHRYSYTVLVGPIPDGLHIDHLCRNPPCVNPAHLEPVTARTNTLRGDTIPARHAAKTHCPAGHLYSDENTYHLPNRRGRSCRTCRRIKSAERRRAA